MCNLCHRCTDLNVGFALNSDDSAVKCYMADTGLLVSLEHSCDEADVKLPTYMPLCALE